MWSTHAATHAHTGISRRSEQIRDVCLFVLVDFSQTDGALQWDLKSISLVRTSPAHTHCLLLNICVLSPSILQLGDLDVLEHGLLRTKSLGNFLNRCHIYLKRCLGPHCEVEARITQNYLHLILFFSSFFPLQLKMLKG